jgi:hypothetical protein
MIVAIVAFLLALCAWVGLRLKLGPLRHYWTAVVATLVLWAVIVIRPPSYFMLVPILLAIGLNVAALLWGVRHALAVSRVDRADGARSAWGGVVLLAVPLLWVLVRGLERRG